MKQTRNLADDNLFSGLRAKLPYFLALTDYTLSLGGISEYTGSLVLTYLDINGSVCIDGWDDGAAHVACRELGFNRGLAYRATR